MDGFQGRRIALLEARMSGELAEMISRRGGEPLSAPAVREAPRDCSDQVEALIGALAEGAVQVVVFMTGVGATALFKEADRLGRLPELLDSLRAVTTVCRGPKPVGVLTRNGVPVRATARSPYTTTELLDTLTGLDLPGKGVAVLHYGEREPRLIDAIVAMGGRPLELWLYQWLLPEDIAPLRHAIDEIITGRVDALVVTSQVQARHLFQVAAEMGKDATLAGALTGRVTVAAVGPTCAAALRDLGVTPHVVPESPKMGPMINDLAAYLADSGNPRLS
jgi:uroporphyrinogen-III synthase